MEDLLILVNDNDEIIGYGEKMETHKLERLHRAFSVFIFNWNDRRMLLHRRADGKYHSGGLWTNTCCSHPRKDEKTEDAVIRRLNEELGITVEAGSLISDDDKDGYGKLLELGKFQYYEKYESCAESEIDHVFYLPVKKEKMELHPDPEEISAVKWVSIDELQEWFDHRPQDFTAWFKRAYDIVYEQICKEAGDSL